MFQQTLTSAQALPGRSIAVFIGAAIEVGSSLFRVKVAGLTNMQSTAIARGFAVRNNYSCDQTQELVRLPSTSRAHSCIADSSVVCIGIFRYRQLRKLMVSCHGRWRCYVCHQYTTFWHYADAHKVTYSGQLRVQGQVSTVWHVSSKGLLLRIQSRLMIPQIYHRRGFDHTLLYFRCSLLGS